MDKSNQLEKLSGKSVDQVLASLNILKIASDVSNFENWLKRVGESPPATAIIRCPYCGRTIEVRLTARKND